MSQSLASTHITPHITMSCIPHRHIVIPRSETKTKAVIERQNAARAELSGDRVDYTNVFSIGVYGPRGSGKTSWIRSVFGGQKDNLTSPLCVEGEDDDKLEVVADIYIDDKRKPMMFKIIDMDDEKMHDGVDACLLFCPIDVDPLNYFSNDFMEMRLGLINVILVRTMADDKERRYRYTHNIPLFCYESIAISTHSGLNVDKPLALLLRLVYGKIGYVHGTISDMSVDDKKIMTTSRANEGFVYGARRHE